MLRKNAGGGGGGGGVSSNFNGIFHSGGKSFEEVGILFYRYLEELYI